MSQIANCLLFSFFSCSGDIKWLHQCTPLHGNAARKTAIRRPGYTNPEQLHDVNEFHLLFHPFPTQTDDVPRSGHETSDRIYPDSSPPSLDLGSLVFWCDPHHRRHRHHHHHHQQQQQQQHHSAGGCSRGSWRWSCQRRVAGGDWKFTSAREHHEDS